MPPQDNSSALFSLENDKAASELSSLSFTLDLYLSQIMLKEILVYKPTMLNSR